MTTTLEVASNPLTRYAPALMQLGIVLVGAAAQLTGRITLVDALQLVPLAANAVLVYLVPLFGTAARSGWKTGVAVLGALVAAGIPFATVGHITGAQVAVVLLAGLQALGAHIGVQIRNDASSSVIADVPPAPAGRTGTAEPPTDTTITRAITSNNGEFLGDPAR